MFVFEEDQELQHVLILNAQRRVQLTVRGASILSHVRVLTELQIEPGLQPVRFASMAAFNALVAQELRRPANLFRVPRARRLRQILQALDGSLAGLSQREIGQSLFGAIRVQRDWTDPSGCLRDRTRRAIARGRMLMGGGYRSLLKGGPP